MNSTAAILVVCLCFAAHGMALQISIGACPTKGNTVKNFNASEYMGLWYEIQATGQFWELGGKCSIAQYSLNNKTSHVDVTNSMSVFGQKVSQSGYAEITSTDGSAELLVTFDVPIFGKRQAIYWVLDTDYSKYAVVYSCSNLGFVKIESAWILGREKTLPNDVLVKARSVAAANHVNPSNLGNTVQDC